MSAKRILVTGAAGFIGAALCRRLLETGYRVTGIDNLNDYYDVGLKNDRLAQLDYPDFSFQHVDIADNDRLITALGGEPFDQVVHLAAQAGVRYSLKNPHTYVRSNLDGFVNILEHCRAMPPGHLVFASSSSVYGANSKLPYKESDRVDRPVSMYAATKRSNELLAYTYSHLYDIAVTGLRFFTVYGPWGRPDMAYYSFTRKMLEGEPITVFNDGDLMRDFTYIDDIVNGIASVLDKPPRADGSSYGAEYHGADPRFRVLNIGNNKPVALLSFIETLESVTGMQAKKIFVPMQDGDVHATYADIDAINRLTGFKPETPLRVGLEHFVAWYRDYHAAH